MREPKLGDIVIFRIDEEIVPHYPPYCPAIVTRVIDPETVNLRVFLDAAWVDNPRQDRWSADRLRATGATPPESFVKFSEKPKEGTWRFMEVEAEPRADAAAGS